MPEPQTPPEGEQQPSTPPEGAQTPPEGEQQPQTFTQEDVDRIVADRLARERRKAPKPTPPAPKPEEQPEEDGETVSKADHEAALEAARQEAAKALQADRVLDRVEILAAKTFADPEDARLRLGARAEEFLGEDGTPNVEAISTALGEVLEKHPHLKANPDPSAADVGLGKGSSRAANDSKPGIDRVAAAYAASNPGN